MQPGESSLKRIDPRKTAHLHSNQTEAECIEAQTCYDRTAGRPLSVGRPFFQGTREIVRYPAVENHQNIYDIGLEYRLSPRWSLIADVPVFSGSRDQTYPLRGSTG